MMLVVYLIKDVMPNGDRPDNPLHLEAIRVSCTVRMIVTLVWLLSSLKMAAIFSLHGVSIFF